MVGDQPLGPPTPALGTGTPLLDRIEAQVRGPTPDSRQPEKTRLHRIARIEVLFLLGLWVIGGGDADVAGQELLPKTRTSG